MAEVLIVDDSRAARMMLHHWLKAAEPDLQVSEAANSREADAVAAGLSENAIIIVDYNMPGENGIALAQRLVERFSAERIFLVTANIQEAVRKKAEGLGLGYIPKPLNPSKLKDIISLLRASG